MAIQTDSCGRYIPRAGDVIFWRFKGKKNTPYEHNKVRDYDKNTGIITLTGFIPPGKFGPGTVIHVDAEEITVKG